MSLQLWLPEGKHEEYEETVSNGQKTIPFWPWKYFHLEIYNEGPNQVKVAINNAPSSKAITLNAGEGKTFNAEHPKYSQITLIAKQGETATVKIVGTR